MKRGLNGGLAALVFCLASAVAMAQGSAPPAVPEAPYVAELRRDTDAVFQGPAFHNRQESTRVVMRPWLKKWWESRETEEEQPFSMPEGFATLALLLKYAVIVALALLLGWLLHAGYRWLSPRLEKGAAAPRLSTNPIARTWTLTGQALPENVSAAAQDAWQRGEPAVALSLLYRGAVQALDRHYGIALPASATEGECLRLARASGKAVVPEGFAPLVRAWMAAAYARRLPESLQPLLVLYRTHFEPRDGAWESPP